MALTPQADKDTPDAEPLQGFADGSVVYVENPKESTKNGRQISELSEVTGWKCTVQNSQPGPQSRANALTAAAQPSSQLSVPWFPLGKVRENCFPEESQIRQLLGWELCTLQATRRDLAPSSPVPPRA